MDSFHRWVAENYSAIKNLSVNLDSLATEFFIVLLAFPIALGHGNHPIRFGVFSGDDANKLFYTSRWHEPVYRE